MRIRTRSRLNLSRRLSLPEPCSFRAPVASTDVTGVLTGVPASVVLRGTVLWDTAVLLASEPGQLAAVPFSSSSFLYQSRSLSPPLLFQSETACCMSLIFLCPRMMSSSSCSKSLARLVYREGSVICRPQKEDFLVEAPIRCSHSTMALV